MVQEEGGEEEEGEVEGEVMTLMKMMLPLE